MENRLFRLVYVISIRSFKRDKKSELQSILTNSFQRHRKSALQSIPIDKILSCKKIHNIYYSPRHVIWKISFQRDGNAPYSQHSVISISFFKEIGILPYQSIPYDINLLFPKTRQICTTVHTCQMNQLIPKIWKIYNSVHTTSYLSAPS